MRAMRSMLTRWTLMFALAVVGLVGGPTTTTAAPIVCLSAVDEGKCRSSLQVDTATFSLEVFVDFDVTGDNLFLIERLAWDPTVVVLEPEGVSPGSLFDDDLSFFSPGTVSATGGELSNTFGSIKTTVDSGSLAILNFRAVAPGSTVIQFVGPVTFSGGAGASAEGAPIEVTVVVPAVIPEPTTITLLGLGLMGFAVRRRRRTVASKTRQPLER